MITCQECDRGGKCACSTFGAIKVDFFAYNKPTAGLRHDLRIIVRISKFRCFHETKQAQNEVERFFLQLGRINFGDFCKVLSQFAFRNMIVPFNTSSSARALKLPSISHKSFLTQKVFTKSSPFSELLSSNLGKTLLVLAPGMPFSNGDWAT